MEKRGNLHLSCLKDLASERIENGPHFGVMAVLYGATKQARDPSKVSYYVAIDSFGREHTERVAQFVTFCAAAESV